MANLFGTINRFISRLDADPNQTSTQSRPNSSTTAGYGFQILRNLSPSIPLEPWFDFIIGINGRTLDSSDPTLFSTEVRNCAGATVSLGVFSAKGQVIRETYISVPSAHESLGLSVQWAPLRGVEDVWHILDVMPNSPADVAGLLPYSDYVIGTAEARPALHGEASLGALVEACMARPLRLFVYNHEYDVTRLVTITPAKGWGGEGALGCVLGFGALHRLPAPLAEPSQAPGETLFDSGSHGGAPDAASALQAPPAQPEASDFLVPANLPNLAQPSPPPPPPSSSPGPTPQGRPARKARAHHASPGAGLDDYFAEGEQKSREVDNAPKAKAGGGGGGLPPPPKAGSGPPRAAAAASETVEGDAKAEGEGEGEA